MRIEKGTIYCDPTITVAAKVGLNTGDWEPLRKAMNETSAAVTETIRERIWRKVQAHFEAKKREGLFDP